MDLTEIGKKYPELSAAANDLPGILDPGILDGPEGHVETGIAAAASLAGLALLSGRGFDLGTFMPGSMIPADLDTEMDGLWNFLTAAAGDMG